MQVVADIDYENIYVADSGNNRVVILNKKGTFVKQYKHIKGDYWNDIKGIGITSDEKKLFVLDGSRVFEVAL